MPAKTSSSSRSSRAAFIQQGYIAANGPEEIRLSYDFDSPAFVDRASFPKEDIVKVEFRLVLGNDYQVWMTSDRQVNRDGEAVLLLVAQAEGNVQDITNLQTVRFEYGLPTATHIFGGNLEIRDYQGFDLYAEYDLSVSYRKYPQRPARRTPHYIRHRREPPGTGLDGERVQKGPPPFSSLARRTAWIRSTTRGPLSPRARAKSNTTASARA